MTPATVKRPPWRIAALAGISVAILAVIGMSIMLFFPGATYERYLIHRITEAANASHPEYVMTIAGLRYSILANRLDLDSVRVIRTDSTVVCSMTKLSISGIKRAQLVWGQSVTVDQFSHAHATANGVLLTFAESPYELRCEDLRVSARDSTFAGDQLEFHPGVDDEQLFAADRFRSTAYHLSISECRLTGLDILALLKEERYRARTARLSGASLSILINKDKPNNAAEPDPRMPGAMFSSIAVPLSIDSIEVVNGRIMYNERFAVGGNPAAITCSNIRLTASGFRNTSEGGDTVEIGVEGSFMDRGEMTMRMSLPLDSSGESFRYSGGLKNLHLSSLNAFIEPAEHQRLKTGVLHSALFDIAVTDRTARGTVRAAYEDLKIVVIDRRSGSERGVVNTLASIFANNVKLRTSNTRDERGAMKIGRVHYTRQRKEPFFQFAWFALRSGVGDVVGF